MSTSIAETIRSVQHVRNCHVVEEQGEIAGSASALMGTLQMVIAAGVMGIVGAFADGTARPMVVAFAACASSAVMK